MQEFLRNQALSISQDLIWRDMDAFGHINNAVYFRFFEDVRIAFFKEAGVMAHKEQYAIGPILASTQCQFLAPLQFPDHIHIGISIDTPDGKRVLTRYQIYSEALQKIVAKGEGLIVFYDYKSNRSVHIPEVISQQMMGLQAIDNGDG